MAIFTSTADPFGVLAYLKRVAPGIVDHTTAVSTRQEFGRNSPITIELTLLVDPALMELATSAHPEHRCHRCGGVNVVWSAPSPLWNHVMRGGSINGTDEFDGIVCPVCFIQIAEQRGVVSPWRLYAENVTVPLETVTPSGRTWDADAWLWREATDG